MTTPLSGAISMNDLNKELGLASPYNQTISLNDTSVRTLLGRPSSTISLSDAYNKSSTVVLTATTHVKNGNIYSWAVNSGWDKSTKVEFVIGAGVYFWSDSTSQAALYTGGSFPGGLTIINNGYIMGKGGNGGYSVVTVDGVPGPKYPATAGGPAIVLDTNCTIDTRNGYIGGGGGGGAGAYVGGGGGAGGGTGGEGKNFYLNANPSNGQTHNTIAGQGGAIGQSGTNAQNGSINYEGGGGGGRIMPGVGGYIAALGTEISAGGSGGNPGKAGAAVTAGIAYRGVGGGAGGSGSAYNNSRGSTASGGGGGWGASGGTYVPAVTGAPVPAAGGKAIEFNGGSYTITWTGGFDSSRVFGGVW